MSRSGYNDFDGDNWGLIRYRGAVNSALRGKRGQTFLREMVAALDALPKRRLGKEDLISEEGDVCALGAVRWYRGQDLCDLDPDNSEAVAAEFDIADAMAREIVFENDEPWSYPDRSSVERFRRMRAWASRNIRQDKRADA